jgi:hypothetical protein
MEQVIRFGVGTADGARSASWRVWVHRGEIYVGARRVAGRFKASLHGSGDWRIGFSQDADTQGAAIPVAENRQPIRWQPNLAAPGVMRAFRVIVPSSEVRVPAYGGRESGNIYWRPNLGPEMTTIFAVILTGPIEIDGWPGKDQGVDHVGSLDMGGGCRVWVIVHDEHEDPVGRWTEGKPRAQIDVQRQDVPPFDVRVIGGVDFVDGTKGFIDWIVGPP